MAQSPVCTQTVMIFYCRSVYTTLVQQQNRKAELKQRRVKIGRRNVNTKHTQFSQMSKFYKYTLCVRHTHSNTHIHSYTCIGVRSAM